MAKGIPLMGRDPYGKAKMINVDENGNVKVQQSGTTVVLSHLSSDSTLWRMWGSTVGGSASPLAIDAYPERMIILENATNAVVSSVRLNMLVFINGTRVVETGQSFDNIPVGATLVINSINSEIINQPYTHLTLRSHTGGSSGHTEGEQKFTALGRA